MARMASSHRSSAAIMTEVVPAYLTAGKMYVPFGNF
jgi:hypothetical protein